MQKVFTLKQYFTSHNFSWEVYPLGSFGTTVSDITLTEYNRFWVGGHIENQDSGGTLYNAVEFNNYYWTYRNIPSKYFDGHWGYSEILAIFSFGADHIWGFTRAGSYVRFQDSTWTSEFIWEAKGSIYAIWGLSPDNVYFAGSNGNITRFRNENWTLLSTTTDVNLRDIWGSKDGAEVWACGHEGDYSKSALLRVRSSGSEIIWQYPGSDDGYPYEYSLTSLYFKNDDEILLTGGRSIYSHNIKSGTATKLDVQLSSFPTRIRGTAENNIFVAGHDGMVVHYNGSTWKEYTAIKNPDYWLYSISCSENQVVILGSDYTEGVQKGVVLIGNRAD